jgi:hypothetical protein
MNSSCACRRSARALTTPAARTAGRPGPVLELGLGNGRTYDHLRNRFAPRPIFVFDREVGAHPDCIPAQEYLRLGDFRMSVPAYIAEGQPRAVFIHADIGSANRVKSTQLAADLAPAWLQILARTGCSHATSASRWRACRSCHCPVAWLQTTTTSIAGPNKAHQKKGPILR